MINLWKKGKAEMQNYYDLKIKKQTDYKSFIFGLVITLIIILPIILALIQVFKVFYYDKTIRYILIGIAIFIIMLCNGLSNYFMVKLAKSYYPENPNLMKIDDKSILFFQLFNPGFAAFTILLVILLGAMKW